MAAGRLNDGLSVLAEALANVNETEGRQYEAEIYRLRGELLLKQNDSNAAEAQSCFERAIEIARKQSAKSLELRATMSLARLLAQQGRRDEARAMLADIYNWFTEGLRYRRPHRCQGTPRRIFHLSKASNLCAARNAEVTTGKVASSALTAAHRLPPSAHNAALRMKPAKRSAVNAALRLAPQSVLRLTRPSAPQSRRRRLFRSAR